MKIYKYILLFLYIFLNSCGYPDIDSVPDFNNLNLTKEEARDLCNMNNSDNEELSKCLNEIDK
mgnify:FL=1|tara:strand:+ start:348 stop:536 length:189 start_codon:yes stop_codon:yes gene_type:complete